MEGSPLASVIEVPTSIPAPVAPSSAPPGNGDGTLALRISSEFTTHVAPVALVDGEHKLCLVQDAAGHPLLFSQSGEHRLLCFRHEDGAADAWQAFDITPVAEDQQVVTFDVTETSDRLVLAVALQGPHRMNLFTFVCTKSTFDPKNISWVARPSGADGPTAITSLLCGGPDAKGHAIVTSGTQADSALYATYYAVDTNPANIFPWKASALPENANKILEVAPARLGANLGEGYFALYSFKDDTLGCIFQKRDHSMKFHFDISGLGMVRDIFSAVSPYAGNTDLFAATEKGIAFFSHLRLNDKPQVLLPDTSFRQVVAAEYGTKIVVFAVSDTSELYYIEGTRKSTVEFSCSGLPIRGNVHLLSVAYNVGAGATELMYVGGQQRSIRHLWRDSVSCMWQESAVTIRPPEGDASKPETRSYPAFVTSITVVNRSTKEHVGAGYKLGLSSDLVYAVVNDCTYALNKKPITVSTDMSGRITIVQEVDGSLGGSSYTVHLTSTDPSQAPVLVPIEPAQRVIQQLSKYNTVSSFVDAKTSDGRPVNFGAGSEKHFEEAASLLGKLAPLVHTVDPVIGKQVVPGAKPMDASTNQASSVAKTGSADERSWGAKAVQTVWSRICDVWETIKSGLRKLLKFVIEVLDGAVCLIIEIGGFIRRFTIFGTVPALIRVFASFLTDRFGINANGLLDWLGFRFDWDNMRETQGVVSMGYSDRT